METLNYIVIFKHSHVIKYFFLPLFFTGVCVQMVLKLIWQVKM